MLAKVHTPQHLAPHLLDAYLERGWFRMGQTIFTTNFLHVKEHIYSTIWLRVPLDLYESESTQKKLSKSNARFKTIIKPASVTLEKEILYALYKQSLSFRSSDSLQQLLYSGRTGNETIYNTYEITVHDGDKLIGCGYFDLGETSGQGVVSFYDPAYKKYSLGKYLIYSKMQYCKDLKLQYFYPGYFVPGNSHFDYKLDIGKSVLEFLSLETNRWHHISTFTPAAIPFDVMRRKLEQLSALIDGSNKGKILKYEFFDANLMPDLRDTGLFDYPVMLMMNDVESDAIDPIVVFDVRDQLYHLLLTIPVWKPTDTNPDTGFYSNFFIKPTQSLHSTPNAMQMKEVMNRIVVERSV